MIGAIQNAALGMQRASDLVTSASAKLSRAGQDKGVDIAEQMVGLMVGHQVYDANGKVIETAEKMLDVVV